MHKTIKLTQGMFAKVDEEDYEELNRYKWSANKIGNSFYAVRSIYLQSQEYKTIYMHSQLTDYAMSDHINGDGLDNRRKNLRECNYSQNGLNRAVGNNTSGYKGVWASKGKFRAAIQINGKREYLGAFLTAIEAAGAYNTAAIKYGGDFARINKL